MKIAVDARELVGHATGVGRYLGELLAEWSASARALAHQWTLYAPQPLTVPPAFAGSVRVVPGSGGTRWEQVQLARVLKADRPDVLFAPGYSSPLRTDCPVVRTIHDVSFFARPEWFRFREGARRRTITRLSAARARVILTDSEFSRQEIGRHLDVPRAKVRAIPLGVRTSAERVMRAHEHRHEPLVLFVGSIFTRRHVDALIRAFARHVVPRVPGSRLEIVGENRSFPYFPLERVLTLQSVEAQRRIVTRAYVDEATLAVLYDRATVFTFPSEYEGFGLTPLEAMAVGVPPVVLDTTVAREIYGDAAKYVPDVRPLEPSVGDAIVDLLTSQTERDEVLRHAPQVLARYRWDRTAAATLAALEEAAGV